MRTRARPFSTRPRLPQKLETPLLIRRRRAARAAGGSREPPGEEGAAAPCTAAGRCLFCLGACLPARALSESSSAASTCAVFIRCWASGSAGLAESRGGEARGSKKTPRSPKSSPSTSLATALMLKSACGGARGRGARGRGGGLRRRVAWRGGAARVDSCAGGATQRAEKRALNRWPGRTDGNAGQSAPGCPGPGPGGASDTMRGCPLIASGTPLSPLPRPLRDCMAREKAAESHAGAGASETHPRARQTGPRPGTESLGTRCPVCRIARARAGAARRRGACGVGRNPGEARSRTCRSGWGRGA